MNVNIDIVLAYPVVLTEEQRGRVRAWCEALDTEDHVQVRDVLKLFTGFSTLGLACELSELGTWEEPTTTNRDGVQGYHTPGKSLDPRKFTLDTNSRAYSWWSTAPPAVQKHYGFTYATGWHFMVPHLDKELGEIVNKERHISWFNDHNWSFAEISYLIRTKILGDPVEEYNDEPGPRTA